MASIFSSAALIKESRASDEIPSDSGVLLSSDVLVCPVNVKDTNHNNKKYNKRFFILLVLIITIVYLMRLL
jgi:hypothetical protein